MDCTPKSPSSTHLNREGNWPFLSDPAIRGRPSEYKAGLEFAISKGRLWLHESGTCVNITETGAVAFAGGQN